MTYKCLCCKDIFEDYEADVRTTSDGERLSVCPNCGRDGYEEAERCVLCGEYFDEFELTSGVCKDCIDDSFCYDEFLEFLTCDEESLTEFFFDAYFCLDEVPSSTTPILRDTLIELYNRKVLEDKSNKTFTFRAICENYILHGEHYKREEYAEWLADKELVRKEVR